MQPHLFTASDFTSIEFSNKKTDLIIDGVIEILTSRAVINCQNAVTKPDFNNPHLKTKSVQAHKAVHDQHVLQNAEKTRGILLRYINCRNNKTMLTILKSYLVILS